MPGDRATGGQPRRDWVADLPVHRGSFVPLHRQIHERIHEEIVTGRLVPGTRLPSEGELAEQWGVSLAPVRQALVDLAAEGYLDRGRGRGTFVRQPKFEEKLSILSSFGESHGQPGARPELVMRYSGRVLAPPEVVAALGARARKLVLIQRLAHLEASPVALLSAYLDPARFPGIENGELEGGSLYRTFGTVYGVEPVRADSVIEAVHARGGDRRHGPAGRLHHLRPRRHRRRVLQDPLPRRPVSLQPREPPLRRSDPALPVAGTEGPGAPT